MAIKTINKALTSDEGTSSPVDCPECQRNVAMRLFKVTDLSSVALLLKEDKNVSFAVCPNCASVFSVNKNYLEEKNAGTFVTITKEDLKLINKNK